jgi:hypothetical protein
MSNQTESYIVLKPIAERFSRIANEMTDDEIKNLIKSELRDQIKTCNFGNMIKDIINDFFEDEVNVNDVTNLIKKSVVEKFR